MASGDDTQRFDNDTVGLVAVDAAMVGRLLSEAVGLRPVWAARLLAGAGVPVFPVVPGAKRPLTAHGFLDASTDKTDVDRWWGRWPEANIGMPTGPVSGVDVVDVDVRPGGDGREAFRRVAGRARAERWAVEVSTPSGSLHLYYPAAADRPQPSWACASAHVDFRGAGGYVVVPPSRVDVPGLGGVRYRVMEVRDHAKPVDAARLRDLLDPARAERRMAMASQPRRSSARLDVSRLADWVAARQEGERNQGLFWAACQLAGAGHSRDSVWSALADAAARAGLSQREIHTTITSAHRRTHPPMAAAAPSARSSGSASCGAVVL